jgi:hypothetical protein
MTLRHAVATLAYRSAKTLRDMPADAVEFRASADTRTALEILAHMSDLLDWALSMANGKPEWRASTPRAWDVEVDRYFAAMQAFDARLATGEPIACDDNKLFQGPIADALTHTGQLAMLRRIAGSPVKGENYFVAKVQEGKVGIEQTPPTREF